MMVGFGSIIATLSPAERDRQTDRQTDIQTEED